MKETQPSSPFEYDPSGAYIPPVTIQLGNLYFGPDMYANPTILAHNHVAAQQIRARLEKPTTQRE